MAVRTLEAMWSVARKGSLPLRSRASFWPRYGPAMTNMTFRMAGAFIAALLVQGCSESVGEKAAATEAHRILETNIRASFDKKDVSISRVNIIQDGSEDFAGSASP